MGINSIRRLTCLVWPLYHKVIPVLDDTDTYGSLLGHTLGHFLICTKFYGIFFEVWALLGSAFLIYLTL